MFRDQGPHRGGGGLDGRGSDPNAARERFRAPGGQNQHENGREQMVQKENGGSLAIGEHNPPRPSGLAHKNHERRLLDRQQNEAKKCTDSGKRLLVPEARVRLGVGRWALRSTLCSRCFDERARDCVMDVAAVVQYGNVTTVYTYCSWDRELNEIWNPVVELWNMETSLTDSLAGCVLSDAFVCSPHPFFIAFGCTGQWAAAEACPESIPVARAKGSRWATE